MQYPTPADVNMHYIVQAPMSKRHCLRVVAAAALALTASLLLLPGFALAEHSLSRSVLSLVHYVKQRPLLMGCRVKHIPVHRLQ